MVNLRRLAEELNIDDLAVCHAGKFEDLEQLLKKDMELGILPPFTEQDIEKRICPNRTMEDARSFIVLLEHYEPAVYKKRDGLYGNISPAATGEDYHRIVRQKLEALLEKLQIEDPDGKREAYVDTSPFSEKHIAVRAGLGRIMRNGLFYSRKYGSRCYIGIVLTNRPPDFYDLSERTDNRDPWFDRCQTCGACMRMCPGHAITQEGMNSYRCVSYLTQKKEPLTTEEEKHLGVQIYGCDVCQKVCPLNIPIEKGFETGVEVDLQELLSLSNKQFKIAYQHTAAGWRGKKVLQRNGEIAIKNIMERKTNGNLEFERS